MSNRTRYFVIASLLVLTVGLGTGLVAYYTGFPAGAFSPQTADELKFVPENAVAVAYADVKSVMSSELRRALLQSFPGSFHGQQEFAGITGIDIDQDVDSVLGFLAGASSDRSITGMAIIRGRFDRSRIEGLMLEHGARVEGATGGSLLLMDAERPGADDGLALAFLEPNAVAVGVANQVRNALSRTPAADITQNPEFMERLHGVSGQTAWVVGRFDALVSAGEIPAEITARIPAITWLAGSARVDQTLHATLQAVARDEQSAADLREVLKGVLALGRLQNGANPEIVTFARSLTLGGTGTTVSISFDVSPQTFAAFQHPGKGGSAEFPRHAQ